MRKVTGTRTNITGLNMQSLAQPLVKDPWTNIWYAIHDTYSDYGVVNKELYGSMCGFFNRFENAIFKQKVV